MFEGFKVALIDDDPPVRHSLAQTLELAGCEVLSGPLPRGAAGDSYAYGYDDKVGVRPYEPGTAVVLARMAIDEAAADGAAAGGAASGAAPTLEDHAGGTLEGAARDRQVVGTEIGTGGRRRPVGEELHVLEDHVLDGDPVRGDGDLPPLLRAGAPEGDRPPDGEVVDVGVHEEVVVQGDDQALDELDGLESEHRRAEAAHNRVDALGRHWLAAGRLSNNELAELQSLLDELSAIYAAHIRHEEDRVFTLAANLLSNDDLQTMGQEMRDRRGLAK